MSTLRVPAPLVIAAVRPSASITSAARRRRCCLSLRAFVPGVIRRAVAPSHSMYALFGFCSLLVLVDAVGVFLSCMDARKEGRWNAGGRWPVPVGPHVLGGGGGGGKWSVQVFPAECTEEAERRKWGRALSICSVRGTTGSLRGGGR